LETETVVGSSGISLSGGQKQRVALARALYAKKELVIIDDGISGVDAETEEAIFRKLFSENGLLRKLQTTVILVTNAIDRLRYADHIMCLDANGHITEQEKFDQLRNAGGYIESLLVKQAPKFKTGNVTKLRGLSYADAEQSIAERNVRIEEDGLDRQTGEWSTYKYYFASIGWLRSLLSLSYLILSGVAVKLTELLITYWTTAVSDRGSEANSFYLGLYGMISGVGAIFWNVATYHYFLYVVPSSAEELHQRLLSSVTNAPLHFFTSTDTGVTTNRYVVRVVSPLLPAHLNLVIGLAKTCQWSTRSFRSH
jgi:ATP-binding cassette, subfamily C (CFTR/MRP), member 1